MDQVKNGAERELPMSTLTEGCASKKLVLLSKTLVFLADALLCLTMRIDGGGILKVIQRRRGHSLIHDIGLKYTYLNMINRGHIKVQRTRRHRLESDSQLPLALSSVSDEKFVERSSTLSSYPGEDRVGNVVHDTLNIHR